MAGDRVRRLQAEPVEGVGAQVGHEDVGACQQLLEPVPSLGIAQVEYDAALAAVVQREGGVGELLSDPQRAEGVAHGVPTRLLDLDHVSAPVRQEGGRRGRGDPDAHLDHSEVCQRRQPPGPRARHTDAPRVQAAARSLRSSLSTFPVALRGNSSTISTTRGTL